MIEICQQNDIDIMLLLICGLPACGKTILANQIVNYFKNKYFENQFFAESIFLKISYDDILVYCDDSSITHSSTSQFLDIRDWKSHRIEILTFLEEFILNLKIKNNTNILQRLLLLKCRMESISFKVKELLRQQLHNKYYSKVIIILDDNFYYVSMRHSIYQICKKFEISFGQIYLPIDKNESISRNYNRLVKVSDQSMSNISNKFEEPNELNNYWEKNTLVINMKKKMKIANLRLEIFTFIEKCIKNPENLNLDIENKKQQSQQSKEVNLKNIIHQTDILLRKNISDKIKEYEGENKKHFAIAINSLKESILRKIKNGELIILNNPVYDTKFNIEFENEIKNIFFTEFQLLNMTNELHK